MFKVVNVVSAGNEQQFFMTTSVATTNDQWKLTLTDTRCVWCLQLQSGDIDSLATSAGMRHSEFVELMRACFCNEAKEFEFVTTPLSEKDDISDCLEVEWKQVMEGGSKYLLGNLKFTKTGGGAEPLSDFLLLLTEQFTDCVRQNKLMVTKSADLEKKYERCMAECAKRVEVMRDCLEGELLVKFAAIVNEKKRKIRDLKQRLGDATATTTSTTAPSTSATCQPVVETSSTKSKPTGNSTTDYSTDDGGGQGQRPVFTRKKRKVAAVKSPFNNLSLTPSPNMHKSKKPKNAFIADACGSSDSTVDLNNDGSVYDL